MKEQFINLSKELGFENTINLPIEMQNEVTKLCDDGMDFKQAVNSVCKAYNKDSLSLEVIESFIDWQANTPVLALRKMENQLTPAFCFDCSDEEVFLKVEKTRKHYPLFYIEMADGKTWVCSSTSAACSAIDGYESLCKRPKFLELMRKHIEVYSDISRKIEPPKITYTVFFEIGDEQTAHAIYVPDLDCASACDDLNELEVTAKDLIISNLQFALEDGLAVPARKGLNEHMSNPEYKDMSVATIDIDFKELAIYE